MMIKTDYFSLVSDSDLTDTESYNSMIMYDSNNRIFAYQKACGCRTIFPSKQLWHPTDGNCTILIDDSPYGREQKVLHLIEPDLEFNFKRIKTVAALNEAILDYNCQSIQRTGA